MIIYICYYHWHEWKVDRYHPHLKNIRLPVWNIFRYDMIHYVIYFVGCSIPPIKIINQNYLCGTYQQLFMIITMLLLKLKIKITTMPSRQNTKEKVHNQHKYYNL